VRLMRVRHHTNDAGLAAIRASGEITLARGWGRVATGIHVEVEPFGTTRPGRGGPADDMGCAREGAFVEFDAPPDMVPYVCGPRHTAVIPADKPLRLDALNPVFVRVRRYWWEFWRAAHE
jgi:hypothetical protein